MSLRFILSKAFSLSSKFPYWLSLRQELQFWHQNRCSFYIITKETFVSWFRILEISFLFLGISRNMTPHKLRQFHEMFFAFVKTPESEEVILSSSVVSTRSKRVGCFMRVWYFFYKSNLWKENHLYFFSSICKSYWGWRQWTIEA